MKILEVATNAWHEVTIEEISPAELKGLTAKRYFFNWRKAAKDAVVYKLRIIGGSDIKGLIAVMDIPTEWRMEITFITASRENVVFKKEKIWKNKQFEGIIGNLIAFAGKKAIDKYDMEACISLFPKTALRQHYIKEYGMMESGARLFLLFDQLKELIIKYSI
jgi:hypothetical protein